MNLVRLGGEGGHLPENDTEAPDVALGREDAVAKRFGGHPADGQETFAAFAVIVGLVDVARHAEVADLDRQVFGHHAVAGR